MTLTTDSLMQIALDLTGWENVPGDCGIHVPAERVTTLLAGLDIDSGDLLLARNVGYDAVLAYECTGTEAELTAWQVYHRHIELLTAAGVPRYAAEEAVLDRIDALRQAAHMANYERVSGAAHLAGVPFLNVKSPVDELGRKAMQRAVDDLLRSDNEPTVAEVCAHLSASFVEFQHAPTQITVPLGNAEGPAGRTVVVHGASLDAGAAIARAYFGHGIDTIIYVSILPEELRKLRLTEAGNLIVTGRVASLSIGLNLYLDAVEARGVEVTRLNGVLPSE